MNPLSLFHPWQCESNNVIWPSQKNLPNPKNILNAYFSAKNIFPSIFIIIKQYNHMHKYTLFSVNYCAHTQIFSGFQKLIILKGKALKVCRKSVIESYVLVSAYFKISQSGLKKIFKFFVAVLKDENDKWLFGLNSNII